MLGRKLGLFNCSSPNYNQEKDKQCKLTWKFIGVYVDDFRGYINGYNFFTVLLLMQLFVMILMNVLFIFSGKDTSEYFLKNYQVGQILGSGGFGTVYSGFRRKDNLPVSIQYCIDLSDYELRTGLMVITFFRNFKYEKYID